MFPVVPGGQSTLQVACTLTTTTATSNSFLNFEDYPQALWHFGAGRVVTGKTTNGSTTITLVPGSDTFDCNPTCTMGHDINHPISGYQASKPLDTVASCIPPYAFIKTVTNSTTAVLDIPANCTRGSPRDWVIENSDSRSFICSINGTGVVTSTTGNFRPGDVGRSITGTDFQHMTTISGFTNNSSINVSHPTTLTTTSERCYIGPASNQTTARFVHDCHTTTGSTTVTSASAGFQSWITHLPIAGQTSRRTHASCR